MKLTSEMKIKDLKCPECGRANLRSELAELTGSAHQESFTVQIKALVCPNCDFKTISADRMGEYSLKVADAYRSKHGLLTSTEIRRRRRALNMSQQEFADYLGVGVASVKRWELGQIQDVALNSLMALKTDASVAQQNAIDVSAKMAKSANCETAGWAPMHSWPTWQLSPQWGIGDVAAFGELLKPVQSYRRFPGITFIGGHRHSLQPPPELEFGA